MKKLLSSSLLISALSLFGLAGCGSEPAKPVETANPPAAVAPAEVVAKPAAPAPPAAKPVALNAEEKAEIAKLTVKVDQDAALAQAKCPVSGEPLGSMGVPIKLTSEGKSLFVCCKGCTKDFEKDPKAVFAKLGK